MVLPRRASLSFYILTHLLALSGQLVLREPQTEQKLRGDCVFAVAASNLWNDLPQQIRQASSLTVFKSFIKTLLFTLAFDTEQDSWLYLILFIFYPVLLF